jgi:hypothetical protein
MDALVELKARIGVDTSLFREEYVCQQAAAACDC